MADGMAAGENMAPPALAMRKRSLLSPAWLTFSRFASVLQQRYCRARLQTTTAPRWTKLKETTEYPRQASPASGTHSLHLLALRGRGVVSPYRFRAAKNIASLSAEYRRFTHISSTNSALAHARASHASDQNHQRGK